MKCMSMVRLSGFAGVALLASVALAKAGVQTPGSPEKTVVQAAPRAPMTAEERAKRRAEFKAKMDARRQAHQAEMAAARAAGTNRLARVQHQMQGGGLRNELEALRAEVKALRADVEALKAAKK